MLVNRPTVRGRNFASDGVRRFRVKAVTRGSSNSLPGPIRGSFVATVNPRQQRSNDGSSRQTVWCERQFDDALATPFG